MKKNLTQLARTITAQSKAVIAGSAAMALYYRHRLPADLDVWNVTKELNLQGTKTVVNDYLTTIVTPEGLTIDLLKPGHPHNRVKFTPMFVDGVRVLDRRDLAASLIQQLITQPGKKKVAFFDLVVLLEDYRLCELFGFHQTVFGGSNPERLAAVTNFASVANQPDPAMIYCCQTFAQVQTKILKAIEECNL